MEKVSILAVDFERAMKQLKKVVSKNSGRPTLEKIKVIVNEKDVDFFATDGYIAKYVNVIRQEKGNCFEFCMYPFDVKYGKMCFDKIEITKNQDELIIKQNNCKTNITGFIQHCDNEYLEMDNINNLFLQETNKKIAFEVGRLKKILSTYKSNEHICFNINKETTAVKLVNYNDKNSEAIILPCRIQK